ncbi:hypothetical protein VAEKB19_4990003 [Vibrio aestuarianus]|nr:hypothetical protein VAEKB19_4990003 [Vibrio aestuarianus]
MPEIFLFFDLSPHRADQRQIVRTFLYPKHNAQLSGEQRTGQAAALHRKTLYLTHSKTATR